MRNGGNEETEVAEEQKETMIEADAAAVTEAAASENTAVIEEAPEGAWEHIKNTLFGIFLVGVFGMPVWLFIYLIVFFTNR